MSTVHRTSFRSRTLAFAAALCGVATGGEKFSLPAADPVREQIIVFRPAVFYAGAIGAKVLVDGKEVIRLRNDQYAVIPVEPGPHKVMMIWGAGRKDGPEYAINAEAGKQRFLHLSLGRESAGHDKVEVTWLILELPREQALPLIEPCELKPLTVPEQKPKRRD